MNNIGESIDLSQIKNQDVVYQVSDAWGTFKYILVIDNKIDGLITGILPNKISPKTLQIDSKNYDLSKYMDPAKINNIPGAFKIKDGITVLLGYDGKIVDVVDSVGADTANYAFVINYANTTIIDDVNNKTTNYTVKLMLTDGSVQTFKVNDHPGILKGKLVKYKKSSEDIVSLERVDYINQIEYVPKTTVTTSVETDDSGNTKPVASEQTTNVPVYKQYNLNKNEDKVNNAYVADNIKIFNVISDRGGTTDVQVKLVNWAGLPNGLLPDGKVLYINTAGVFNDVAIMVVDDIFNENYKYAVLKINGADAASGKNGIP